MSNRPHNYGTIIPAPNRQVLQNCLANGQLDVATALAQTSQFVSETLKTIEEFSEAQAKLYLQDKLKMDKLIDELSEKCQAMQQALLFKEEKYDEKCREVNRYKMICEMAAKEAKKPLMVDKNVLDFNNDPSSEDEQQDCKDRIVKLEAQETASSISSKRHTVKHTKFSKAQAHLSEHLAPLRPASPQPPAMAQHQNQIHSNGERRFLAPYYAGGPSKRRATSATADSYSHDYGSRVKQRLEMMGGVNLSGPQLDTGPVSMSRLVPRPTETSHNEELARWATNDVTGQRNEVFSSNAQRMKQRIVEKDLHKQVSSGSWNRLASRRKKDWPF